jgi:hypothetical protein
MDEANDDALTPGRVWTAVDRRRIALAGVATLLLVGWLLYTAFSDDEPEDRDRYAGDWPTSDEARSDVPGDLLVTYQQESQNCPGLPWPVVAAIGKQETNHNREPGTSTAGATGPMQFLPATWAQFQADGDGDGVANIEDEEDSIAGAVRLLCASGGDQPATLQEAILTYNQSPEYVDAVLETARSYTTATIEAP